ncbi:hypothetical protein NBRC110019_17770 [Neptunitalea chrysea]|uniref:Tetratricopeptide repeat protein n=1 Tax=Neptunitalea chrysea TaxID=1647581 RepID=A0A9W6B7K0_9FLAO|nr:tetratricopeptide repeat protein [Neptunitalea chrysea]GLB52737.1 hypothetical protein NBRC110019_17770 [Neptunitalea chrysea]
MLENSQISKVDILLRQGRYAEAEKIANEMLSDNPDNPYLLKVLAEIKALQKDFDSALLLINDAIGKVPHEDDFFYLRARVLFALSKYDLAEFNIKEAISFDPSEADYFAFWANIKLYRKGYQEALDLANKALELDAENIMALNARSTALLKLNDKEGSFETIEGALHNDPDNYYTHANYGWGLLEKGDHKKAMIHFQESLQRNPNYGYAQQGMLEAIKAKNLVYRLFLKYAFFMSNKVGKYQWGILLGMYVIFRVLENLADKNEALEPFIMPIVYLYIVFAISTWIINPISNLFLRFNKYGKFLLEERERKNSSLVAISAFVSIVGFLGYLITRDYAGVFIGLYGLTMMIPLSRVFNKLSNKLLIPLYTIAMALVGLYICVNLLLDKGVSQMVFIIYGLMFLGFQFMYNAIAIKQDNV